MREQTDLIQRVQGVVRDLALVDDLRQLYRRAVEGLTEGLGFDRASLWLYSEDTREVQGSWSTDDWGLVYDDSDRRMFYGDWEKAVGVALAHRDKVSVTSLSPGWEALVVVQDGDRTLGWFHVDDEFHRRSVTRLQRQILALHGRTVGTLIQRRQLADLIKRSQEQNALKDNLLAVLAHDLRGPVGNLGMLLKHVCDQPTLPEDLRPLLTKGQTSAFKALDLLDNILDWIRGQIQEVSALKERFPVRRSLDSVREWHEGTAQGKGIEISVVCLESLTILCEGRALETIVRNFVSNALKYSSRGSVVVIRGVGMPGEVWIEVEDQGVGMSAERLEDLFSHRQAESVPGTSGETGSGLGLLFCGDLARSLGARLEAQSLPEKGTTFRLVVPDLLDGAL